MTAIKFLQQFLPVVIYILLIVLIIVGIIIGFRALETMKKLDKVVDNVNDKVESLNGLFNVVDFTTDKISLFTDKIVDGAIGLVGNIFKKRKKKKKVEEEEYFEEEEEE